MNLFHNLPCTPVQFLHIIFLFIYMFFLQVIVFAALFALALAAPQGEKDAVVVRYDSENIGVDGYNFG